MVRAPDTPVDFVSSAIITPLGTRAILLSEYFTFDWGTIVEASKKHDLSALEVIEESKLFFLEIEWLSLSVTKYSSPWLERLLALPLLLQWK